MIDCFNDFWERDVLETVFEEGEKPGKVKDDGIGLIKTYHETVSPTIQPVQVEQEFNLDLDGCDYTLKGFIDLVDRNSYIIDHKTAKRSWREDAAANDLQLTAYALAYRTLEGKEEGGLRFDIMVRTKQPKIQQLATTRNQRDIDRFIKTLAHVYKAIESGIFYPNENWMCPSCGYKNLCDEW